MAVRGKAAGAKTKPRQGAKQQKPKETKVKGANGAPQSDVDFQGLLLHHLRLTDDAEAKHDRAKTAKKKAYELAKSEGITKRMLDKARKFRTEEGERQTLADTAETKRVGIAMNSTVGRQIDLFEQDRTPAIEIARGEGFREGIAGHPKQTDKWHPGTPQYAAFMDGYHQGQLAHANGFKRPDPTPLEEKVDEVKGAGDAPPPETGTYTVSDAH